MLSILERIRKNVSNECRETDKACIRSYVSKYIDSAVLIENVIIRELNGEKTEEQQLRK